MKPHEVARDKSPIEMFYHWEENTPNKIFLRQPVEGRWHEYSWSEVANQVRRLTSALFGLGLKKGDRVAIISKNCAEWVITDLALQLGGFVSVPLYFDQTPESFQYILEHSEAEVLFVGKLDRFVWDRLRDSVPARVTGIGFSYHGEDADFDRTGEVDHFLPDLVKNNRPYPESPIPKDDDWWTFIYTSGTTGNPKGAVHCYRSARHSAPRILSEFEMSGSDRFFSFLPLAHVAERVMLETSSIYCNGQMSFNQSLATFSRDLKSVKPTMFFSVPRLWKKFQGGILENMPQARLDLLLSIPLVGSYVSRKIRNKLGFSKTHYFISGAAPISPALLEWYAKIGINIQEGYGMTENFGYGCVSRPGQHKEGTVGFPLPDSGFKLSEQGEILFKSPALMECYYQDEERSREVLTEDGYFRSGDLGEVDEEGFVRIAGRIKESFKTEKGEYVSPAPIEAKIAELKDFEQICLSGSGLTQPVAIVTLSEIAESEPRSEITRVVSEHISKVNDSLLSHEKIGGVVIANADWTTDSGLVTPTLKVRRNKVEDQYRDLMGQVIASTDTVLWEARL